MATRRGFLRGLAGAAAASSMGGVFTGATAKRPNVVWILGDDLGPELGCYGCAEVRTPNIDRLAREGARYTSAFTTAPVCSPSRSALITGMYATSIGAHHHRSHRSDGYRLPAPVKVVTEYFRAAAYFTANATTPAPGLKAAGKTDFNFDAGRVFDGTDWNQRKAGQPFYAQVNFTEPHRGAAGDPWGRTRKLISDHVDPARVALPPCYADHPIIREDWAGYLDAIGVLDGKVGRVLKRLEEEGLAQDTIIFFFGDNGQCHIRGKQFLYDGGIHVPLILRWPGALKGGTVSEELISGIDFAATSLALAGMDVPAHMQGRVFLGEKKAEARPCIHAARDRCDETVDRIRCVRDKRYKYIRNFMPQRPYTQPNKYKEGSYPALAVMRQLYKEGKLDAEQAAFMAERRPEEELYDLRADPYELKNLAGAEAQRPVLREMRRKLAEWMRDTRDQGEIPET